ncbi:MAG: DUF192 domain-containing protein [Candidatus Aenigmarchaeota archaeon]|nr:DUF192 domain-containing protein [Candidatus Aenigmarchaeota archaeon]MCX8179582.1 DUF192 domain-containing protein [Candidatus Aenigmarchaeota archaeon]
MRTLFKPLSIFLLIFLLSGCLSEKKEILIHTANNTIKVRVEIADTEEKRRKGLMFRQNLKENEGMLFVFEEEMHVSFWMKNTFLPLDMIFISSNGTINEIKQNLKPCFHDTCEIYKSSHPSKYVLEVNANFAERNNIKVGDLIRIN